MVRCEGMTRNGGMMTFGPVEWVQCKNEATVLVKFKQTAGGYGHNLTEGELPACHDCWVRAKKTDDIKIVKVEPIDPKGGDEE